MSKQYKVKVHYTGSFDDGSVFDSSHDRNEALEFTQGAGQVVPGFDKAVASLEPGQSTKVRLEPAEAYGEYQEELVQSYPCSMIPNCDQLPVGQSIYLQSPEGYPIPAKVLKIEDDKVFFDFNHEMAGKVLNFEISLLEREEL